MKKEEEVAVYLTEMVAARKVLDNRIRINGETVCAFLSSGLLLNGAETVARLLNIPYMRESFSEKSDKISFHWNGYEVYDLDFNKRIAHKK